MQDTCRDHPLLALKLQACRASSEEEAGRDGALSGAAGSMEQLSCAGPRSSCLDDRPGSALGCFWPACTPHEILYCKMSAERGAR